jgi:hypothetical protein
MIKVTVQTPKLDFTLPVKCTNCGRVHSMPVKPRGQTHRINCPCGTRLEIKF